MYEKDGGGTEGHMALISTKQCELIERSRRKRKSRKREKRNTLHTQTTASSA